MNWAQPSGPDLSPTLSVFFLNFIELSWAGYHSMFQLLDVEQHQPLTDDLQIHVLQLPRLLEVGREHDPAEPAVVRWGRFLATRSPEEMESLAMSDPNLREAKAALERLSADPVAQQLAEEREFWAWNHEHSLRAARKEGEARGEARGRALAAQAVILVLEARGIGVSAPQRSMIELCQDLQQLEQWVKRAAHVASVEELLG